MTPKEYLLQIKKLNVLIDQRINERDELRRFNGMCSVDYAKDKVQTFQKGEASFVNAVEKAIELEAEIDGLIDDYIDLKNKIIGEIQSLNNPTYIQILYKKYVEFKRLEVIAVEMAYSYQYVRAMHGFALQAFGKVHTQ